MSQPAVEIVVDETIRSLVRVGCVEATPVAVAPSATPLLTETEEICSELRGKFAGRQPSQIEGLDAARELYKAFGIDPTKTRPSSEALLRRVLRDKPLPRISNAVDLCNLLSIRFLLPLGLYDLSRIDGPVHLRRGAPDESYPGIRKDVVNVHGRPVLVDQQGPFSNPTSDSLRTSVTSETRSLLLVIFAPHSLSFDRMAQLATDAATSMARHLAPPDTEATTHAWVLE